MKGMQRSINSKYLYNVYKYSDKSFYVRFEMKRNELVYSYIALSDVDECQIDVMACNQRGTCVNTMYGYTCECYQQWEGARCQNGM